MIAELEKAYAEIEAARTAFDVSLDDCLRKLDWTRECEFKLDCYVGHEQKENESNVWRRPIVWRIATRPSLPDCAALRLRRVFNCDAGEVYIGHYCFESHSIQALVQFVRVNGIQIKKDQFYLDLQSLASL